MKKLFPLLLALVMVMGLAACGTDSAALAVETNNFSTSGGWIVTSVDGNMLTIENRDCSLALYGANHTYEVGDHMTGRYTEYANGQHEVTGILRDFWVLGCHQFGDWN